MNIDKIFRRGGVLENHFANYEFRPGQIQMSRLIQQSIREKKYALIEAATGSGKSLAYLIPIILSGKRAIISTSNKNLQDQLDNKDLPLLKEIIDSNLSWEVLKGKRNYFCPESFSINKKNLKQYYIKEENLSETNARLKIKNIVNWAKHTETGDLDSFEIRQKNKWVSNSLPRGVKNLISCQTRIKHDKNSEYYKQCFAVKARQRAKKADILLVNHSLVAFDIALRQESRGKIKLLPDSDILVIDEAHKFNQYTSMAFSDEISYLSLLHLLNWSLVKKVLSNDDRMALKIVFNHTLNKFLPERGINGYYQQKLLRKVGNFSKIILLLKRLIMKIQNSKEIQNIEINNITIQRITLEARNLIKRLEELSNKDDNTLCWSEAQIIRNKPYVRIKSVKTNIAQILKENLFKDKTIIFTSATLTINDNFNFFINQLGIPKNHSELILPSPFDFKKNSLIYITKGDINKVKELETLLSYSKGRALILFTSYKEMNNIFNEISIDYPKLIQEKGKSRKQLLEKFKTTRNAILFATNSFWEGIDIQGEQLSLLVIWKIPFENPSNLIYKNKIEQIDRKYGKGKHWRSYTIPLACLRLKQGVGRLIRSKNDKGTIALLDPRINYRSYKRVVLASFPPAYRTQLLSTVGKYYQKWNQ